MPKITIELSDDQLEALKDAMFRAQEDWNNELDDLPRPEFRKNERMINKAQALVDRIERRFRQANKPNAKNPKDTTA